MTRRRACAVCGVTLRAAGQLFLCHACRTPLCVMHLAGWRLFAGGAPFERVPLCLACLQPTDIPLDADDRRHEQQLIDQARDDFTNKD